MSKATATLIGFIIIALNIYIPVSVYIDHAAATATPVQYIILGMSIYFWIDMLRYLIVSHDNRKRYSVNDVNSILHHYTNYKEEDADAKKKDGYH